MMALLIAAGYFAVAAAGVFWAGYSTADDPYDGREDARITASIVWPIGFPILFLHGLCSRFLDLADMGRALALKDKKQAQLPEAKVVE